MSLLVIFLFLPSICNATLYSMLKSVSATAHPWPNNTVYYFIDDASDYTQEQKDKINQAVKVIQDKTCIDFIEGPTTNHAIIVKNGFGCTSAVGTKNPENNPNIQPQALYLHSSCFDRIGTAIHEFMHSLGLVHMHSRTDRDEYIRVNFDNVLNATLSNFLKSPTLNITPYDYTSYMHYASNLQGTVDPNVSVMIPLHKDYRKTLGALQGSFYDFHGINLLYKCYDKCLPATAANCTNGGMPHPRNCSKCLCPSGFAGDHCDERPGPCGQTFTATTEIVPISLSFGKENDSFTYSADSCTYWFLSPPNHKVELFYSGVNFVGSNRARDYLIKKTACTSYGWEFKTNPDPRLGGPIFCHDNDWGVNLASDLNPAPLILFRHRGQQIYEFQFVARPIKNQTTSQK